MLSLKPIELDDKSWIDPIVMAENTESADFAFGNMFIWDEAYGQYVSKCLDRLVTQITETDVPFFAFPVGSGELIPVIEEMKAISDNDNLPLIMAGVTDKNKQLLEELMPGKFEFTPEEIYDDYVYDVETLSTLAGQKLHAKRNHINKFISLYPDWHYEKLERKHFDECFSLLDKWRIHHGDELADEYADEAIAIQRSFDNYERLQFEGGVLYVNDTLCAFTLGEKSSPDTFLVHFEKADIDIEGAFPMINREFVRMISALHPEIKSINRGDDVGLESLRKAKRSYKPFRMVEKYTARLI